jgi:hypothetical protein
MRIRLRKNPGSSFVLFSSFKPFLGIYASTIQGTSNGTGKLIQVHEDWEETEAETFSAYTNGSTGGG